MKKTHLALAALAIAIAAAPLAKLQAASMANADPRPHVEGLTPVVKARMAKKRHTHRRKYRRPRHARSKGPGRCGENMYWSGKKRSCMDARNKA